MGLSGQSKLFCMGYSQELKDYKKLVFQNTPASEPFPKLDPNFVFTGKMDGDKDSRCTSSVSSANSPKGLGFRFSGLPLARNEGRILIVVIRTYHRSSISFSIPSFPATQRLGDLGCGLGFAETHVQDRFL